MAEREERRGRHIEITLVDVRLGSPIAAAGLLGVVDRHLPDVPREREGQLPGGVGDAEDGVGERGALARSAEVGAEDGRQAIDDGGEPLR